MIIILSVAGFIFVLVIAAVMINIRRKEGKLGINLKSVTCPKCNTSVTMIRKPTSAKEAIWGGWSCSTCGCKMDKWGNEIA